MTKCGKILVFACILIVTAAATPVVAQKIDAKEYWLDNGMQVKLFGEISVYEARGSVQLIVKKVEPAGEGELQAKFDRLKNKFYLIAFRKVRLAPS